MRAAWRIAREFWTDREGSGQREYRGSSGKETGQGFCRWLERALGGLHRGDIHVKEADARAETRMARHPLDVACS